MPVDHERLTAVFTEAMDLDAAGQRRRRRRRIGSLRLPSSPPRARLSRTPDADRHPPDSDG
jgi:hypothetical protein